ncbi:phage gp6-like head-tail connector protein [Paenibacillus spongiae]|uniref:Phage gp6-like head-tail connector protein n=1 Tax=Paenibacillus spongiae TaxID=2909671 RepID=A0ABY5S608_9BACL|nr:phage gp6-like head-tail connector protein [Paenibacillus spongiae]UVI28173.1 phage gp6-like head-tail connector protein [Paenibacillus spongiae]
MLTNLERLKRVLPKELYDPSQDDRLELDIAAASAAIENYCKRSFKKQLYTERVSGYETSKYINLRNYPVHSITEFSNAWEYEILDDGRIYCANGWPTGEHNIKVSYIGGYVLPGDATNEEPRTLPEPLELACLLYVQMLQRDPGIKSERVGNINVTYIDDDLGGRLPAPVVALISPYVGRWV